MNIGEVVNIGEQEALRIAREDAERVYLDLSIYTATAQRDGGVWRVSYSPTDPFTLGGGPSYVISAETGEILERRYEQ